MYTLIVRTFQKFIGRREYKMEYASLRECVDAVVNNEYGRYMIIAPNGAIKMINNWD